MTETAHAHNWQPFHGWSGRYVCAGCRALGYRKLVLGITEDSRENERIIPYACSRSGCTRDATHRTRGQLCAEHEKERVAKEVAKDELAKARRAKRFKKVPATPKETP